MEFLSKWPAKVVAWVVTVMVLGVALLATLSYIGNQPFMFNGQEFGFGAHALRERSAQLQACQDAASASAAQIQGLRSELVQARQAHAQLVAEQQARAQQEQTLWAPVDDVVFAADGSYRTQLGGRGKGRWASPDGDIELRLLASDGNEAVLAVNLPDPWSRLRLGRAPLTVTMAKWQYRLSASFQMYDDTTTLRVERRPKSS